MKKIVVVDNSPVVLKYMTKLLSGRGHHVMTAEDGLSALDIFKNFTPDVLFIDLIMPNIDGEKLCGIVRTMPQLKDTYVVIFSAVEADQKPDLARIGADAYVAKGNLGNTSQEILNLLERSDHKAVSEETEPLPETELHIRREVSRELLISKKHLETILESMSEGVLEINAQNRIVFGNPAATELIGITETELLGTNVSEIFESAHYHLVLALLNKGKSGGHQGHGEVALRKTGKPVGLDVVPFKISGGEAILILNDVSARKQAEAEKEASETNYRNLFENAPVGLWEADFSDLGEYFLKLRAQGVTDFEAYFQDHPESIHTCIGLINIVNANKCAIESYAAADKKELAEKFPELAVPESLPQFTKALAELAEGKTSFEGMTVSRDLTGEKKHFLVKWTLVPGRKEHFSRVLVSHLDLSDRMEAAKKMRAAVEEAEHAREALIDSNDKLEKANKELELLTRIDGLTGIANRRYFDQVLDEEWRRALRTHKPLSFILGDIDHFKLFNDFYGHYQGDECLKLIAETLNGLARRPGDLVARYGGEEFGIILSHTSAKDAYLLAERMRATVLDLKIAHKSSDVTDVVTLSLGVASFVPERKLSPDLLIEEADRALYRAKSNGRNQVQLAENPFEHISKVSSLPFSR